MLKVAYKGLIVVSVPLLFQLVFVFHLSQLINDSRREFETELLARNSIILANRFMSSLVDVSVATVTMVYSGDQKSKQVFTRITTRIKGLLRQMQELTREPVQRGRVNSMLRDADRLFRITLDGALESALLEGSGEEMTELTNSVGLELRAFTQTEERQAKHSFIARRAIKQRLNQTLIGGLSLDIILTFVLSLLFTGSISKRLEAAKESIKQLGKHEVPVARLQGDDEIALLDNSIFESATELRHAMQSKSDVMTIIKQQLQTPLSILASDFDKLIADNGKLSEGARHWLTLSRQNLNRLLRMVHELLDNASGLHEKFALSLAPIELFDLLSSAVSVAGTFAEAHGVSLRMSAESGVVFRGDHDLLCQVVLNLITNAVKFSPRESEVLVRGIGTAGAIIIEVIDKGSGIPPQAMEKIFKPFQQVNKEDASVRKGTGLGLAICKAIVEQHGGSIIVESMVGQGSCFRLKFDLEAAEKTTGLATKRSTPGTSVRAKGVFLVLLPLVVTCSLVWVMQDALHRLDRSVERELRAKQAVAAVNQIIIDNVNAARSLAALRMIGEDQRKAYQRSLTSSKGRVRELAELLADEPSALKLVNAIDQKINVINSLLSNILSGAELSFSAGLADNTPKLVAELNKSKQLSKKLIAAIAHSEFPKEESRAASFQSLDRILPAALIATFAVTAISSLYFTYRIANRLSNLREGVEHLRDGEITIKPAREKDEIAELQNYFYQTANRLVELEQFRGYVVGVVSHEMKTPLQTILGAIDLLESGALGDLPPECEALIEASGPRTKRIIRLVHDLLDIEKIHSGTFALGREPTHVLDVCQDAVSLISDVADDHNSQVVINAPETVVLIDRDRIVSILGTLLENLIKAAETRRISLSAIVREGEEIRFEAECLTDCMDPDLETDVIFERFFKESFARTKESIFFHISRDILKQHNGHYTCESHIRQTGQPGTSAPEPQRQLRYTIVIARGEVPYNSS